MTKLSDGVHELNKEHRALDILAHRPRLTGFQTLICWLNFRKRVYGSASNLEPVNEEFQLTELHLQEIAELLPRLPV